MVERKHPEARRCVGFSLSDWLIQTMPKLESQWRRVALLHSASNWSSVRQSMRCSTSLTFRWEYRATDRVSLWPDTIMICALLNPFLATFVILVCLS